MESEKMGKIEEWLRNGQFNLVLQELNSSDSSSLPFSKEKRKLILDYIDFAQTVERNSRTVQTLYPNHDWVTHSLRQRAVAVTRKRNISRAGPWMYDPTANFILNEDFMTVDPIPPHGRHFDYDDMTGSCYVRVSKETESQVDFPMISFADKYYSRDIAISVDGSIKLHPPFQLTPLPPQFHFDSSKTVQPHKDLDVYYIHNALERETHEKLKKLMLKLTRECQDYILPMYHNVIDPNNLLTEDGKTWIVTDLVVENASDLIQGIFGNIHEKNEKNGDIWLKLPVEIVEKIFSFSEIGRDSSFFTASFAGPVADLDNVSHFQLIQLFQIILNKAIPILCKFKTPPFSFPGKLQVAIKAQRIYLKGDGSEEYEGIWHQDGDEEHIVAVILYYHRITQENIIGGAVECVDRIPLKQVFGVSGDTDVHSFTMEEGKEMLKDQPRAKIDVKEGTLLVFSNYQTIHRVLKMTAAKNSSDGKEVSRDFIAFFVVDQRRPLTSTFDGNQGKDKYVGKKQEKKKKNRTAKLINQLTPKGKFGFSNDVIYTTGNGSIGLLGWVGDNRTKLAEIMEEEECKDHFYNVKSKEFEQILVDRNGLALVGGMNLSPPKIGRGISWLWDDDELAEWETRNQWEDIAEKY